MQGASSPTSWTAKDFRRAGKPILPAFAKICLQIANQRETTGQHSRRRRRVGREVMATLSANREMEPDLFAMVRIGFC
jgi:hypothetical protein